MNKKITSTIFFCCLLTSAITYAAQTITFANYSPFRVFLTTYAPYSTTQLEPALNYASHTEKKLSFDTVPITWMFSVLGRKKGAHFQPINIISKTDRNDIDYVYISTWPEGSDSITGFKGCDGKTCQLESVIVDQEDEFVIAQKILPESVEMPIYHQ